MKQIYQIFLAFFRAGMLGYGGGPSSIPLIHREVVTRFGWMDDEEFSDILAIGNTLPGPIATKMAGYIGYRVAGVAGCLTGLCAMVLPTVILMIALLGIFAAYRNSPRFEGITHAVSPVVAVMLAVLAYSFFKKAWSNHYKWLTVFISAASTVAIVLLDIHPAVVIGILLISTLLIKEKKMLPSQKNLAKREGDKR
ncbi:chromate transporter [Paenactinomyces guangxiensis]|uniref:Chromate transporter n=1 Tax=Paenactinomyces guangxiensis TaxID=1490290 RepID=A0A7W1WRC6_9BACL|nr:chromate transporter [Paenactinomyces guangxiensis]MBA4494664.1 chromate transporter [Paenactinomyces guangxiensis]MBH8591748.1 chromate transporter [Paenactinomyces guangxiensis]